MNVSEQDARESLASAEEAAGRMRKSLASTYCGPFLIVWGVAWIICFLGSQFSPERSGEIFPVGCGAGAVVTVWLLVRESRRGRATRNPLDRSLELRTGLFWVLVFAYTWAWLVVLRPGNGIRLNAFLCMIAMFAYVMIGLWFCIWAMVVLGIAVTAATVVGCLVIPPAYYCVWMAVTAGGGLLGTGLYMQFRWR
jgi:hypothetical protein